MECYLCYCPLLLRQQLKLNNYFINGLLILDTNENVFKIAFREV